MRVWQEFLRATLGARHGLLSPVREFPDGGGGVSIGWCCGDGGVSIGGCGNVYGAGPLYSIVMANLVVYRL